MDHSVLIKQLGGSLMMMGAHSFSKDANSLIFKIRGSVKGNAIRITLEPSDTYKIELWKRTKWVDVREDVYVDSLRQTLASMTGLATSL